MKSEKGFALLEVMIAVGLLGLVGVAFLGATFTASKAVFITDERATAESLARSQMEYMKSLAYIIAPSGGQATYSNAKISAPSGYEIRSINRAGSEDTSANIIGVPWSISFFNPSGQPASPDAGLQRVKLVIKHGSKQVLTLEDFKVKKQ